MIVVPGGNASPLLVAEETAFDGVALDEACLVESGLPAALGSLPLALLFLVDPFRDGCAIRLRRSSFRVDGWEYALSASNRKSRVVSGRRCWRCRSSSGSNCGLSPLCPGVRITLIGRVRWSFNVWIFGAQSAAGSAQRVISWLDRRICAIRGAACGVAARAPAEGWCARTTVE